MKSSILVGGQAVIEGVMMRVPGAYATAVRLKDKTIKVEKHNFISIIEKYKMNNYIILRGVVHLYESMKMGYKTLDWSANMQEEINISQQYSLGEEIANSTIHGLGIIFSIVALTTLMFYTSHFGTREHLVSYLIYQIQTLN